jgi:hypothetical protein
MEAGATFEGARSSRTFVAGVLVLVALGVGAAGGYAAASLGGSKAAASNHAAPAANPATQQDYPNHDITRAIVPAPATLPAYLQQEIAPPSAAPRLSQDYYPQQADNSGQSRRIYDAIPGDNSGQSGRVYDAIP